MQTKRLIVALMASMAVFYLWLLIAPRFFGTPRSPDPATQPAGEIADGAVATRPEGPTTAPAPAGVAERPPTAGATQPAGFRVVGGEAEQPVTLGSAEADSSYPMKVEISPRGAAITNAWIRGHYETPERTEPYHILRPVELPNAGIAGSFITPQVRFDNRSLNVPLEDAIWRLDPSSTDEQKIWTVTIQTGEGEELARVIKTYTLAPQPPASKTYDLGLSLKVENLSGEPARLILTQRGPVGLQKDDPRAEDRRIIGATWSEGEVVADGHWRKDIRKAGELPLGADRDEERIAWVAEANRYFAVITAPAGRDGPAAEPLYARVAASHLLPTEQDGPDLTYSFVSKPLEVPAGGATELNYDLFIGPKSKTIFQGVPAYDKRDYFSVIREGFYFCAPEGLTSLMMTLLNFFQKIGFGNYGVAIIILVLVVRGILHPITKKSQVNMMKMQKQMSRIQPRIEAVKQKFSGDRVAMNQAIMEVYKEEGVNPAGNLLTCLPMMLQIPIWGALWQALASTIEMRHAPFDGWWIRDLAGPDALISFRDSYPQGIDIPIISWLAGPIFSFNLLPILLGVSQLLQAKYMPRISSPGAAQSDTAAAQMEQQRKMMMFMSGFFVLMLYGAPSGLNLYIMASNFFAIFEQWRIRKHIAELDSRKGEEPPPSEPPGAAPKTSKAGTPPAPKQDNWLQRKWKELEKQAEEARKVQSQRRRER
jgi:YidC/Oxa1 family membrane protein insertase